MGDNIDPQPVLRPRDILLAIAVSAAITFVAFFWVHKGAHGDAPQPKDYETSWRGFTLIELSIVLVVIGLVVGGVLVGRDLLSAASVRAQISQIEKFQQAVNTFRGKYGYLPGDITSTAAQQFGFSARNGAQGRGNGNGVIEGYNYQTDTSYRFSQSGETTLLWADLGATRLINGAYTALDAAPAASEPGLFLPSALIGQGNFMYVFSGDDIAQNGHNYFSLSVPDATGISNRGNGVFRPGLTVRQAYDLDAKIDDGLPYAGNVLAMYYTHPGIYMSPYSSSPSPISCYDLCGGTCNEKGQYSLSASNGTGMNCALSFKFQ